jgi:MYXO-CTERM domain-containing protein
MRPPWSLTAALCFAFVARAHLAHAEPDTFGLGSGLDGSLSITGTATVNDYAPITADTGVKGLSIVTGSLAATGGPGFAPGNLVLVWQTTGLPASAAPSGSATPIALTGNLGAFEFARIDAVAGSTITLTNPLVNEYAATGAQIVRVPEYTDLLIPVGASVTPYPWDGSSGGIVAFFVTGIIELNGFVDASATGFRGGIDEPIASSATGCAALDGPVGAGGASGGGAHKGEGLVPSAFSLATNTAASAYGFGNVATGGGGGDCLQASGGGGGNAGAGGAGGEAQDGSRAVGGYGGVPLTLDPTHYLSLGGGGGAGNDIAGAATSASGAAGGGVVLIRAFEIAGVESYSGVQATGGMPPESAPADAQWLSAGGGGAGGTIVLQLATGADCGMVDASGGHGGLASSTLAASFGGGGGGGFILYEAVDGTCPLHANAGMASVQLPGVGAGAAPGAAGIINSTGSVFGPTACSPQTGACGGCTTNAATSICPADLPVCVQATHTCGECTTDADCADSVYGGVCGARNLCGACNATENLCTGGNPVCDTSGTRATCVACNGDLGTTATSPCPGITSPYCMLDGSCGTCGAPGASQGCAAFGAGITHSGPVCGAGGACTTMCSVDSDCTAAYCDAMDMCEPLLPDGAACDRAAECVADQCTDGKCGSGSDLKDAGTDSGRDAGTKSDAGGRDSGSAAPPTPPRSDGGNGTHPAGSDSGAESADGSSSSGCSCRSARSEDVPGSAMLAGLTAVVVSVRRRRRV